MINDFSLDIVNDDDADNILKHLRPSICPSLNDPTATLVIDQAISLLNEVVEEEPFVSTNTSTQASTRTYDSNAV
jgi:hypothetical protein